MQNFRPIYAALASLIQARPIYAALASLIQARANCIKSNNEEWKDRHEDNILQIVRDFMPSGSGWDCGTKIDLDASHEDKLVFLGEYHHMNDGGYYDGRTSHTINVLPSLTQQFKLKITGRDRNSIKEYLYELFASALCQNIQWDATTQRYTLAKEDANV